MGCRQLTHRSLRTRGAKRANGRVRNDAPTPSAHTSSVAGRFPQTPSSNWPSRRPARPSPWRPAGPGRRSCRRPHRREPGKQQNDPGRARRRRSPAVWFPRGGRLSRTTSGASPDSPSPPAPRRRAEVEAGCPAGPDAAPPGRSGTATSFVSVEPRSARLHFGFPECGDAARPREIPPDVEGPATPFSVPVSRPLFKLLFAAVAATAAPPAPAAPASPARARISSRPPVIARRAPRPRCRTRHPD